MSKDCGIVQVERGRAPWDVMTIRNFEVQMMVRDSPVHHTIVRGLSPARAKVLSVGPVKIISKNVG